METTTNPKVGRTRDEKIRMGFDLVILLLSIGVLATTLIYQGQ